MGGAPGGGGGGVTSFFKTGRGFRNGIPANLGGLLYCLA